MFENLNNHKYNESFDEGRYLDTGDIDPFTGKRGFNDTDKFVAAKQRKDRLDREKIENERMKRGVCKYCGQESCNPNVCNYA